MPTVRLLLVLALVFAGSAEAQSGGSASAAGLEGAWSRVETGPAVGPLVQAGPGLMLFVDGHYSWIYINGTAPRPPLPGPNGTAADLRAVLGTPIVAEAGTYEVKGDSMTRRATVSKSPTVMQPANYAVYTFRRAGDTLWVYNVRTQSGAVANRNVGKYLRLAGTDTGGMRGAWSHVEVRSPDGTLLNNQPGLRLLVDGHFARVRVNGLVSRVQPDSTATAAQILAAWGGAGFEASSGTYTVIGDVIIESPMIAMNPAAMRPGNYNTYTNRFRGDTLISTNLGLPAGQPRVANVGRYVRVRARPAPTN